MRTPKARVVVGSGMSNEFQVNIGLKQGSALSPLLFILVMELISRKISTTDALRKIMYADDLVIVAEHREELQGALEEWNDMFKKHGLKMNLDKTEVMWVGKQREELNIRLEEKDIKQVKNFVYLGGNISENGRVDVEVRRRIQAGANAWRNVEGVMVDRKISRKLKGKVLDSCVVPASTYGLETLALSELHQHKLQVCENNWIRKIAGVRRVERRRMKDLREEVGSNFGQFSHTLIDNFFLKPNNLAHKTIAGVFLKKLSDHQPYFVLINIKLTKERTSKYIQINIQTDVAMEKVKNELIECDLYGKLDTCISADINANYDILHSAIKQAKNKHMPCKFIKFNKYKHKKSKWITRGLLKSIRSRDKLYARLKRLQPNTIEHNTLLINLKTYNNILKRSIRTAKTLYFEITFQKFKYDIRNTWKTLNDILSRNKTKDPLPTKLRDNINAIDITNKSDIANTLNNFFTSIGRNLAQNINYTGDKNHRYYLKTNHEKVFKFKEIEQESITMVINSLTNKSSVGIDGISTILLKCIAPSIIKPLTLIINQIMKTGVFPNKMKLAKVIPIYKNIGVNHPAIVREIPQIW